MFFQTSNNKPALCVLHLVLSHNTAERKNSFFSLKFTNRKNNPNSDLNLQYYTYTYMIYIVCNLYNN